ncbi:MAG: hypothetical protein ACREX9_19455 [Gammaproteobacteria bacterium]
MTSIALIAAGGTSASGLAVLALTRFSARKRTRVRPRKPELKEKSSMSKTLPAGGRCGILRRRMLGLWKGNSGGKSS